MGCGSAGYADRGSNVYGHARRRPQARLSQCGHCADRSRNLTNGQPGTLTHYIDALNLAPGNRVYHMGAGAGYYTPIMAEVVGATGTVVASEVHPELGLAAQKNLSDRANVTVHKGDGTQFDPGECDAMLINAGMTHPLPLWLDRLRLGGRLLLPITGSMAPGC